MFTGSTWHSNITTSYLARVDHERADSRLYKSGHNQKALFFNTCIHAARQQAAVYMLNHSSQLKSLLSGSKLPDSDLLLTSNPNPDRTLSTTFQSGSHHSPIHQNEGSAAFIFSTCLLVKTKQEFLRIRTQSLTHDKHLGICYSQHWCASFDGNDLNVFM